METNGLPGFLGDLVARIQGATEIPPNLFGGEPNPVKDGEVIIGTLGESVLRIIVARNSMLDEGMAMLKQFKEELCDLCAMDRASEEQRSEHDKAHRDLVALRNKAELVDQIFWQSVRSEFSETSAADRVGVRDGYQLVKLPKKPGLEDLTSIDGLLGLLGSTTVHVVDIPIPIRR